MGYSLGTFWKRPGIGLNWGNYVSGEVCRVHYCGSVAVETQQREDSMSEQSALLSSSHACLHPAEVAANSFLFRL